MTTCSKSISDSQEQNSSLDPKIIVALDFAEEKAALNLVTILDPKLCKLKVGKELFTAAGPQLVGKLVDKGFGVFLDLKFHDIPSTVQKACKAASNLGVWMLNVHASGGLSMMQAAREGLADSTYNPLLIAVTVLTSLNQATLLQIGVHSNLEDQVLRLARLTQQAALDGVVCSAHEISVIRKTIAQQFCLVTPGIRQKNSDNVASDDQTRVMTPAEAMHLGADYLVIGRPITQANDPLSALYSLQAEIATLQTLT